MSNSEPTRTDYRLGVASRFEAFRDLARARARGEVVLLPRMLTGDDRRQHVRQTIREDHRHRIADGADDTLDKFDKLAGSAFAFFRGSCLLFYRDLAGEDAWLPTVLAVGDVHPENFGLVPSADGVPMFAVDDFDEACYAPFTWDLKRGATGFLIAAEANGLGRKKRRKVARSFVRGYVEAIVGFAGDGGARSEQTRQENAPQLIADLIAQAREPDRATWLARKYLDEHRGGFRADDELEPLPDRRSDFQAMIDRYIDDNRVVVPAHAGKMRVKDVCVRKGQGTASLGLARYYVLIEGVHGDGSDDLILDIKRARRSALSGLVPPSAYELDGEADRVARAHDIQQVRGDVFYGSAELDGQSFIVRERAPYRDSVDLDELSKSEWREYARICAATLAQAHARSDAGALEHDAAAAILDAVDNTELFVGDIVRFAEEAADRVSADHQYFRADHSRGAFRSVDIVYR